MNKTNVPEKPKDLVDEIHELCNRVLRKEKATKRNGKIIFKRKEIIVKVSKRTIGSIIMVNKKPTFQYTIDQAPV